MYATALAALAGAVLHGLDLHVVPVFPERAENPAVVRHVAIPVGGAFPDAHGRKMRRLQAGDVPLIDGVIGNAVEPNFAARPRLRRGPFDTVVKVFGLARRKMINVTWRTPAATRIDPHAGVIVRHPFFRVDHLPTLIKIAGAGGDVGVKVHHALPGARVAVLESKPLGIRPVTQDNRVMAFGNGTKNIGAQHQAVVHRNRHVPIDPHAIASLAALFQALAIACDRRHTRFAFKR